MAVSAPHRSDLPLLPGLALACSLALLAMLGARLLPGPGASPLILVLLLGVGLRNLVPGVARAAPRLRPGTGFALRRLLRLGVVLLGLQLTLADVARLGAGGVAVLVICLGATFVFTLALGRRMGLPAPLCQLIAAGSSICGASAVLAADAVVRAEEEDVAYAVACVTLFGTLAMLLFPLIGGLAGMAPAAYGLWTGAAIHEVAQVVAAGWQRGAEAGQVATLAKLARVAMLAPVIVLLAAWLRRGGRGAVAQGPVPRPWFVAGFLAMVLLASTGWLPAAVSSAAPHVAQALLAVALAAMGLETDLGRLRARGLAPLGLAAASALFIATLGFALVQWPG